MALHCMGVVYDSMTRVTPRPTCQISRDPATSASWEVLSTSTTLLTPGPALGISFEYYTLVPTPRDHSNHIHMNKGHILISLRCGQYHQRLWFLRFVPQVALYSWVTFLPHSTVGHQFCFAVKMLATLSHSILQKGKKNNSRTAIYHHLPSHILI